MNRLRTVLAASLILLRIGSPAHTETPHLQIYFDPQWRYPFADCPDAPVMEDLYIVAEDFEAYIAAIEFSVDYPHEILWVADLDLPPVTIGTTPTGVSTAWALPQNGFSPFLVARVRIFWNCDYCHRHDVPLCANVHPVSGFLRAVRFPDYAFIYAVATPACLCPCCWPCVCPDIPVPTEATTWGKIKELYQ